MATGLATAHPDRAFAGGVVKVAVFGHREHLAAAVLDAGEGLRIAVAVAHHPHAPRGGRIMQPLIGAGEKLSVILQQVAERAASGTGIAGHPNAPGRRGILDVIVGRVDPNQLAPHGYHFRHNRWFSVLCKVRNNCYSRKRSCSGSVLYPRGITFCDTPLIINSLASSSHRRNKKSSGNLSILLRTACLRIPDHILQPVPAFLYCSFLPKQKVSEKYTIPQKKR